MIFLDTNVVSETLKRTPDPAVTSWLARFDVELALSTVAIAEVAYGIEKIRPDQRSRRLERGLAEIRRHFADRIYPFTEQAALALWRPDGRTDADRTADVGSGRDDRRGCQGPRGETRDAEPRRFRRLRARADLPLGGLTAGRRRGAISRRPFQLSNLNSYGRRGAANQRARADRRRRTSDTRAPA